MPCWFGSELPQASESSVSEQSKHVGQAYDLKDVKATGPKTGAGHVQCKCTCTLKRLEQVLFP